jgi:hypothetical protein
LALPKKITTPTPPREDITLTDYSGVRLEENPLMNAFKNSDFELKNGFGFYLQGFIAGERLLH